MLAELAAFNAAFAVVKQTVSNSGDLARCAKQIGQIVGIKQDLEQKVHKKKNGFLAKIKGETANDFEEFMALESIKEAEKSLQEAMIWVGRPGLWSDWQRFQAEARKERQRQKELAEQRRADIIEYTIAGVAILALILALVGFIWWVLYLRGDA